MANLGRDKENTAIQGLPLENANAISPVTITNETLIEFVEEGDVTIVLQDDTANTKTILAGSRYAIGKTVKTITFSGTFSVH